MLVLDQFDMHHIDEYDVINWIMLSAKESEFVMLVCQLINVDMCFMMLMLWINYSDSYRGSRMIEWCFW